MDPLSIALICAAVFGTVTIVSAFIRQMLISRDKKINDEAQSKAIAQEILELRNMRAEMLNGDRYNAHYHLLGDNKNAIKEVDLEIEKIFASKAKRIESYSELTISASQAIISGNSISFDCKGDCDKLRSKIYEEIAVFDQKLKELQDKRSQLWGVKRDEELAFFDQKLKVLQSRRSELLRSKCAVEKSLLAQEQKRNENMDKAFARHAALLEKIFLRHTEHSVTLAVKGIEASTITFKDVLMAPVQLLMNFFSGGRIFAPNIAFVTQSSEEQSKREQVARAEADINASSESIKKEEQFSAQVNTPRRSYPSRGGIYHAHHKKQTKHDTDLVEDSVDATPAASVS